MPHTATRTTTDQVLRTIPLAELYESPLNPRQRYEPHALEELAASLKSVGQLTPLTVRPKANGKQGKYEIGAGHRRFRAAALAGLTELLVVVRELDNAAFVELLNVENLQRDDLHPLEEAEGFKQLMTTCGYDVAKIAARIGRSTRYVYDSLTLLKLIPKAKTLFLAGQFERGHAIELARLAKDLQQEALEGEGGGWSKLDGLFQRELAHEGGLDLDDDEEPRKPVSVREFKTWVDDRVRFSRAHADPMLFPETVQALETAASEKERVIEITYEYQTPDAAKVEGAPKLYTARSWRSATPGIPDAGYSDGDGEEGAPCEHAITGVVVIGERRGEAFKVCIAKEKCRVHWADWQKDRARRQKQGTGGTSRSTVDEAKRERERWQAEQKRRAEEGRRWRKALPAIRKAVLAKIDTLPITPRSPIVALIARAMTQYGLRRPKVTAKTADGILRDLARGALYEYRLREQAQTLGVDWKAIVDQVAPAPAASKAPVTKRPIKKRAARQKAR